MHNMHTHKTSTNIMGQHIIVQHIMLGQHIIVQHNMSTTTKAKANMGQHNNMSSTNMVPIQIKDKPNMLFQSIMHQILKTRTNMSDMHILKHFQLNEGEYA